LRPHPTLFPYTTLFRSYARQCDTLEAPKPLVGAVHPKREKHEAPLRYHTRASRANPKPDWHLAPELALVWNRNGASCFSRFGWRSEEHTSELQSRFDLV